MSYCRREGKDTIIFATEEDLSTPSSVVLLPDNEDLDKTNAGAILPNGEINWECPCLGNLPNGPCGPGFREAFSCWVQNKDDNESFAANCFDKFSTWEKCLSENKHIYKTDDEEDKNDSNDKIDDIVNNEENNKPLDYTESKQNENTDNSSITAKKTTPAIAAASTLK